MYYWEVWKSDETTTVIHHGKVGKEGKIEVVSSDHELTDDAKIDNRIKRLRSYKELDSDDMAVLYIEYDIEGVWGNDEDLPKRHALQERMDDLLGWRGLGFCDGGSIGAGTMEVCCYVCDFNIALRVIKKDLKGTDFDSYTKIFLESE